MTGSSVSALHDRVPGITEDLLATAVDTGGLSPYSWLAELVPAAGPVLDLCCGSAPMAEHVVRGRYLGVDSSAAELAVATARRPWAATARADSLTVDPAGRTFAGVTLSMALMLLPLEAVLSRAREWLAPGGVVAATVPLRDPALDGSAYNGLLSALGWQGEPFPEPMHALSRRAATGGFTVESDELRHFAVAIAAADDRELLLRSFYLPDRGDRVGSARTFLLAEVSAGGSTIGYPIRRICLRLGVTASA